MDSLKSRLAGRVKTAVGAVEAAAERKDWRCYFDLVDHFRQLPQEAKAAAVVDAPPSTGDIRLDALLASMVMHLCDEAGVPKPDWSTSADF